MSAAALLSRLEKVKPTGPGRYSARCPSHQDKGPSLSIRELDDGRVLLHCFAGCETGEVLSAVGLDFTSLFPECLGDFTRERVPFPPADALRAIMFEALVVQQIGGQVRNGETPEMDRLSVAIGRISAALDLSGVRL